MGKRGQAKKQVNRLQLRREAIRVLASDTLVRVVGGVGGGGWCGDTDGNGCGMTVRPTGP